MTKKLNFEDIICFFKEQNCELLENSYKNIDTPMKYKCSCGNISKITFYLFRKGGRCFECSGSKKHTIEEVKKIFKQQNCELLENNYKDNKTKMKYKCSCNRISYTNYNRFVSSGSRCKKCQAENNTGDKHPRWNPNLTQEDRIITRTSIPMYRDWRRSVYQRDYYTCQKCGQKSGILNAHHIKNYNTHQELRYDINNGITFCKKCHINFHSKYGNKENGEEQLIEYLNNPSLNIRI